MRQIIYYVVLLLLVYEGARGIVFQGSCADKDVLCEQLCVTLSPETYECGCWNDHILLSDGIGCKVNSTQVEISYTTTAPFVPTPRLKRDRTIWPKEKDTAPLSFSGGNFAEFPTANSAYLETNITIEFKSSTKKDSILFFAGQFSGDDYISIAIIGPNIILRHDCGEGAIEDMYRGPFALDTWHTVTVWRKYCDRTEMRVDKKPLMVDLTEQFKFYKGITMDEGVFVGGAPSKVEFLDSKAGTDSGFQGCIRKIIVNDEVLLDTENEINWAVNIEDLEYCSPITQAQNSEEPKVLREIDLSTGLPYKHVADRVLTEVSGGIKPLILPKVKENKETIAPTIQSLIEKTNYELLNVTAPDATTKQPIVLKVVEFTGGSFITVPAPNDIIDYLELRIHFKPNTHSGILFFWQDGENHLGLFLEKGFVNVQVTMGADTAILRSEDVVSLHQWHRAEVWRTGKGILMKVDRQSWVESQLSAVGAVLADPGMLFIGGFDSPLPLHISHLSGFHGCVKKIRLNGRSVPLRVSPSQNVRECGADPCAQSGCPKSCAASNNDFVCLCQWPKYGRTCSLENSSNLSAMKFQGHSYLEFDSEQYMNQVTGDSLKMSVELKLTNITEEGAVSRSQIIAYSGESGTIGDFFRLLVTTDLMVQFMTNLGSGLVILTHPIQLRPERWTTVDVIREKRHITLSVNGESPITTVSPEGSEQLNVYRSLFIGGLPTNNHADGFRGCIRSVSVGLMIIDEPKQATSAINIQDCSL